MGIQITDMYGNLVAISVVVVNGRNSSRHVLARFSSSLFGFPNVLLKFSKCLLLLISLELVAVRMVLLPTRKCLFIQISSCSHAMARFSKPFIFIPGFGDEFPMKQAPCLLDRHAMP